MFQLVWERFWGLHDEKEEAPAIFHFRSCFKINLSPSESKISFPNKAAFPASQTRRRVRTILDSYLVTCGQDISNLLD